MGKIAVSGSRGLLGKRLTVFCIRAGEEVVVLTREMLHGPVSSLAKQLEGVHAVFHLSGAPVIQRWTKSKLHEIYESRIRSTRKLVEAFHVTEAPPALLISMSATGIYEKGGPYTESNALLSTAFLGKLCQDWEREAQQAESLSRVVIFRMGILLDASGGALKKMLPVFRMGLGGPVGNGKQPFPWVHPEDVVRAFRFALENQSMQGVYNLTSPQIINNLQFAKALAGVLQKTAWLPVPRFLLSLLYGKGSRVLTEGQEVMPERLLKAGFSFHYPQIGLALNDLLVR